MVVDAICLIMSGARVGDALAAEFGPLPRAFLPVAGKRLYELQIAKLKPAGPIHIVLPETFRLSEYDHARLEAHSVEVIRAPEEAAFGEAVIHAISSLGRGDTTAHILSGGALFERMPTDEVDVIAAADHDGVHGRTAIDIAGDRVEALERASHDDDGRPVAAGYFAFASSLDLARALTRARGDFVAGVNGYLASHEVRTTPARGWLDFERAETYYAARRSLAGACGGPADRGREYEPLPSLSELFVYGALGRKTWLRILGDCEDFLKLCAARLDEADDGQAPDALAAPKTLERLEAFARDSGFPIDRPLAYEGRACPSLVAMAEALNGRLTSRKPRQRTSMHGDFGFSSILYCARTGRIRTLKGSPSLCGDIRYDLAKLACSVVGRYDQIIAGRYCIAASGGTFSLGFETLACQPWLADALRDLRVEGVGGADPTVRAMMISLFLSMTPLHADRPDRQRAFVANALRLFLDLD
jgi:hypothetical protein